MRAVLNQLATEISKLSSYADTLVQLKPMEHDKLYLFEKIKANKKNISSSFEELTASSNSEKSVILLNGNLNHNYDIHDLMLNIKSKINRFSRLAIVLYNPYFAWAHSLLKKVGLKKTPLPTTYLTRTDLKNILDLSGYEIIQTKCVGVFPWNLFGFGRIINLVLEKIPFIKWFSQVYLITVRPIIVDQTKRSLSIVVPARNEYGNIRDIMERLIDLKLENKTEVIFVEGNSTDDTWEEILNIAEEFKDNYSIQTFQQKGKGKGDAVRLGFEKSKGELLTILDADLSMPPELLPQFVDAFHYGHADFINGTRLVYPMEGQAMRPLNWLGNIFFAKLLSWILEVPLGDSLCGTKLFHRDDYARIIKWWDDFGEHDPFGDFQLLFPASVMALGIKDIPIRYRARTYGETNIDRFNHGSMLFKITLIGILRLKLGLPHGK
jgi:hypothetical protein